MKHTSPNHIESGRKPDRLDIPPTPLAAPMEAPAPEPEAPSRGIVNSVKHSAKDVVNEAVALGGEIKNSTRQMADNAVKDGKDACASTEKAVLNATEKALNAVSNATAKAARSVHKTNQSK